LTPANGEWSALGEWLSAGYGRGLADGYGEQLVYRLTVAALRSEGDTTSALSGLRDVDQFDGVGVLLLERQCHR